jgi:hypothetical protein
MINGTRKHRLASGNLTTHTVCALERQSGITSEYAVIQAESALAVANDKKCMDSQHGMP